jgi:hypothetical protein
MNSLMEFEQISILQLFQKNENFSRSKLQNFCEIYSKEVPKNSFCYFLLKNFVENEIVYSEEILKACRENESSEFKEKPKRKLEQSHEESIEKKMKTSHETEIKESVKIIQEIDETIPEELIVKMKEIQEIFKDPGQSSLQKECEAFKSLNIFQLEFFLKEMKIQNHSEEFLLTFTKLFIDSESNYQQCCSLIKLAFYEKIKESKKIISRIMFNCLSIMTKFHEKSIVECLLKPLLFKREGKNEGFLNSYQLELSTKLVEKNISKDVAVIFLEHFFEENIFWSDLSITLLKNLINLKLAISDEMMTKLLIKLEELAPQFNKSTKFGLLMFSIISKYESTVRFSFLNLRFWFILICWIWFWRNWTLQSKNQV